MQQIIKSSARLRCVYARVLVHAECIHMVDNVRYALKTHDIFHLGSVVVPQRCGSALASVTAEDTDGSAHSAWPFMRAAGHCTRVRASKLLCCARRCRRVRASACLSQHPLFTCSTPSSRAAAAAGRGRGGARRGARARLAEIMRVPEALVSVKATTSEKLGFTGRGEGIATQAVASLVRL